MTTDNQLLQEIVLRGEGACLELAWQDGTRTPLAASRLRAACRCAECTALRRRSDADPQAAADLGITGIEPIGSDAINIHFSDGHRRGIYPFAYLRELADDGDRARKADGTHG